MNKIVYTYYEPIGEINMNRYHKQEDLIDICEKSWRKNGWEFIVLNYDKAKEQSFYKIYSDTVKKFPSVNPSSYDYHCYMRWLAMAQVGGGLMIDYDVVNINFTNMPPTDQKKLSVLQFNVPCVVHGSSDQYLKSCEKFCELIHSPQCAIEINNKPHTSDMIMITKGFSENDINKLRYVVDYPNIGSLIHFSWTHCENSKKDKLEAMREVLKL